MYTVHEGGTNTFARIGAGYEEMVDVSGTLNIRVANNLPVNNCHKRLEHGNAIAPVLKFVVVRCPSMKLIGCVVAASKLVHRRQKDPTKFFLFSRDVWTYEHG